MIFEFGQYELDIDVDKTKEFYKDASQMLWNKRRRTFSIT